MEEKKAKQESGRLSSLARPRDLNLSVSTGAKNKKVYAPNVNAIRNKNKSVPSQSSDGNKRSSSRQSNKDFKRTNASDRFVQSTGIFSEGTNEVKRASLNVDRTSDARDGGEPSAGMEKPKLDRNATWNIDVNAESEVINDLLNCNFFEEIEHSEYQPIVLPLKKNSENFFKNFAPKPASNVKLETGDTDEHHGLNQSSLLFNSGVYNENNIGLTLVKLPNSMPGRGFDENDKVVDYTLDQMMEGQIGKIVKRRSGKMEIIIGDTTYSLESAEASPFREDVMAVPEPDADPHSASMRQLGTISEKIVVSPSWHHLLPNTQ